MKKIILMLMMVFIVSCGKNETIYVPSGDGDRLTDIENRLTLIENAIEEINYILDNDFYDLQQTVNNISIDITNIYDDIADVESDLEDAIDSIEDLEDAIDNFDACTIEYRDLHSSGPNVFADIYVTCDGDEAKLANNVKLN